MTVTHGQSALDGFDPNANFYVKVVAAQPDGKILIGGEFTSFSPNGGGAVTRNRIARLNADGSLDTTFDPNAGGTVNSVVSVIVVQPDGKILIGGDFATLVPNGGLAVPRNHIARLNPDGSLDTAFNPNASAPVGAITVQADGKILVGGSFTSIGGQPRNGIARLDATTGAADSFNPNASGGFPPTTVNTIVVQSDGRILAGGSFLNIGGQPRNRIARLDPVTGAADSFNPSPDGFTGVQEIIVQPDGRILVGGGFGNIGGQARNSIARLDPVTGAADSWNPNANNTVHAMALQPDGKVLIGGDFNIVGGVTTFMARLDPVTGSPEVAFNPGSNERVFSIALQSDGKILAGGTFTSMGGQTRNRIGRLETDGRLDRTLVFSSLGRDIPATAIQPDGKILIGGKFDQVLGVPRRHIARLHTDGTLDTPFNPQIDSPIESIAVQADGKILLGGFFTNIDGQTRNYIARLHSYGGLDSTFNPDANGIVRAIAVEANGKILAGGDFSSITGQARQRIARLHPNGTLDTAFNPDANESVFTIVLKADGKILVGGSFTTIGGEFRNHIARLDATNGLADSFNPDANDAVHSIAVQADGKVLAGGNFTNIGGQARIRIARLDATTGVADSFNPSANNYVFSIALQADGKILAGGSFTSIGGQARNRIGRINPTTGVADPFNPNASDSISSITVQSDGKILVGGRFSGANAVGGQTRDYFARLGNDTVAQQDLAVTQSAVIWTRGGSSPKCDRVTFEGSTNNVNYNLLGSGVVAGSNWILTGLNLSTGQNLYIRARGYYRSGYLNGSECITESVRNVFFPAPPPRLSIQRSANTNVVLSWATSATGFTLESKTNLNTNIWNVVTNAPAVTGTNNVVTNPVSGSMRFYRLRQ